MMDEAENQSQPETLDQILESSGFTIVPLQPLIDALAKMEEYIMQQTGLSQEELDEYLQRIEDIVGPEGAQDLELDDIINWIETLRSL